MNTRLPPRYLPTLTEVVHPDGLQIVAVSPAAGHALMTEPAPVAVDVAPAAIEPTFEPVLEPAFSPVPEMEFIAAPVSVAPDRHALAQQIIQLVRPQLEVELRTLAQEHFDAQFNAFLPSLHQKIEAAVREAIAQSQPVQPGSNNDGM